MERNRSHRSIHAGIEKFGNGRTGNLLAGNGIIASGAVLADHGFGIPAPIAQTGMAIAIDATKEMD